MADVRLFHTHDGGEIDISTVELSGPSEVGAQPQGRFVLDHSPATAAYLSLFGGNERDGGGVSTAHLQWWGNVIEPDRQQHLRSETQHLLATLPAVPANLRRIEDAAVRDLAWMVSVLGAEVGASASMPGLNRIQLDVTIDIDGTVTELRFSEPWGPE